MAKQKLIVFSGAGMSAESGLKTFRDSGGLWEKYDVNEIATPDAWKRDPVLVLDFYNQRREQMIKSEPNDAHYLVAELQKKYDLEVITQNIDDLHERAGAKNVLHLHGLITKARSVHDTNKLYDVGLEGIKLGDLAPDGKQLRPHVVWFGEEVPEYINALERIQKADIFIIIGTSLNVYPAAGLIHYCPAEAKKFLIDPKPNLQDEFENMVVIEEGASAGMRKVIELLL